MAKPARFAGPDSLQIFQDEYFENATPMISHAPMPTASKPPRRPLQSANGNVILNPPSMQGAAHSPYKTITSNAASSLGPLESMQGGSRLAMVPMMPPTLMPQSTDNLEKRQPIMSKFKTASHKQGSEGTLIHHHHHHHQHFASKENMHPVLYPSPANFNNPMLENYDMNACGKRVLLEPAPIKPLRPAKKPKVEEALPLPESFPPIIDDGQKPGHSYAILIGMAILRSPQRRLTLAQIYKWISDTYTFYNPNDAGWQNSIRHNLSLNKNFVKQERPKDDPGKGNYWAIEGGAEHIFTKDKSSRKSTMTAENVPIMSTRLEPALLQPQLPLMSEPVMPLHNMMTQASLPPLPASSHAALPVSLPTEVSSDATIAQSELAILDELTEKATGAEASIEALNDVDLYSPLPGTMHSSPPIPKHLDVLHNHNGTPPSMQRRLGSSASKSRSHKRKFASMDDSGYISSLESSAMRPNQRSKLLTSEADRPRIRRGRAEEEIARLRASSYDSPTKSRSFGYIPASSSPLRRNNEAGQMLPPLTPAMKLKAPPKPPPSVSPSTNLRLHRESVQSMIESPYRRADLKLPKDGSIFNLAPNLSFEDVFDGLSRGTPDGLEFEIFQDSSYMPIFSLSPAAPVNGSPAKRSVKKQRLDRSQSTSALTDATNNFNNIMGTSSFLHTSSKESNTILDTPSKVFDGLPSSPSKAFLQSPSKMPPMNDENVVPWINMDEFCGTDLLDDGDFTGIDMLAGFERIGSSNAQMSRSSRQGQKPPLGRSYSTNF
jgi:forkhead transcription factor HCM1